MQRYILYAPTHFCFKAELEKQGFKQKFIEKNLWKFHYVFSLAIDNLSRTNYESRFVRVDVDKLDKLFRGQGFIGGKRVRYSKFVIEQLGKWNVLIRQRINSTIVTKFGKLVNLTRVELKVNDTVLEEGYQEWTAPAGYQSCELEEEPLSFDHLIGIYRQVAENNQSIIEFDAAAARVFALQAYQQKLALPAKRVDNVLVENRYVTKRVYSHWLSAISRMERKLYRPTADNAVGKTDRFFSLISNLPRPLRQFISLNGQAVAEVDISSSQPLIFAIYLKQYYQALGQPLPADVEHYTELCETGDFYRHAQSLVLAPGETMAYDLFKVTFFARIFFSNELRQYQWRTRFAVDFPNVSRIISEFKSENYKDLPQKLSHLESEIMLHRITPRLFAEGITEQFSLHDSFFCTSDNKVRIEQIVVEEYQKYGVTPHLKNKSQAPIPATAVQDEPIVAADPVLDAWWLNPTPTSTVAPVPEAPAAPITDLDDFIALIEQKEREYRAATSHLSAEQRLELLDAAWEY